MSKTLKFLILLLILLIVLAVIYKCYTLGIIYGILDVIGIEPSPLSANC
jgi:hypothetical protein